LFGILLAIGFYITGSLKTFLGLPRPPSPPVIPLEHAIDWALPSHHSLVGVIMPWYVWLYTNMHYELSALNMALLWCSIVIWSFGIMLSRMYLGVHSPADIVSGGIVGVIVLSLWVQMDDFVDFYISQRIENQIGLILVVFMLLLLHPSYEKGNPSFGDTCILSGVFFGIVLGRSSQKNFKINTLMDVYPNAEYSSLLMHTTFRFLVGGSSVMLCKVILKSFLKPCVISIYKVCGFQIYSGKMWAKSHSLNKHFSESFLLPPIYKTKNLKNIKSNDTSENLKKEQHQTENKNKKDINMRLNNENVLIQVLSSFVPSASKFYSSWDTDIPVNFITYCCMTYTAVNIMPNVYELLSI